MKCTRRLDPRDLHAAREKKDQLLESKLHWLPRNPTGTLPKQQLTFRGVLRIQGVAHHLESSAEKHQLKHIKFPTPSRSTWRLLPLPPYSCSEITRSFHSYIQRCPKKVIIAATKFLRPTPFPSHPPARPPARHPGEYRGRGACRGHPGIRDRRWRRGWGGMGGRMAADGAGPS